MKKPDQPSAAIDAKPDAKAGEPRRPKAKASNHQIDIRRVLEDPMRILREGKSHSVSAFEATVRQHLRKSIVEKSMPSLKFIIETAEKYQVIKKPPPPPAGGVFIVPKDLPDEVQREIFDYHPPTAEKEPMSRIVTIIRRFYASRRKRPE